MRFLIAFLVSIIFLFGSTSIMDRKEAEKGYKELLTIGETDDPKLLDKKAIICNDLALFYQSIDDNEQSIIFLEQTIDYTKKRIRIENEWNAQNLKDVLDLYDNLTSVQASSGYIAEAKHSFEQAEVYFKRLLPLLDDSSLYMTAISHYSTGLGFSYHSKQSEQGNAYGKKVLHYAIQSDDSSHIAEAHRKLGELKSLVGDNEGALIEINEAIESLRRTDTSTQIPQKIVRSKIGILYKLQRYSEIIEFMANESPFDNAQELEQNIVDFSIYDYNYVVDNIFILSYAYIRNFQAIGESKQLNQAQKWQNLAYSLAEKAIIKNGVDRLGQVISNPDGKMTSTLKNYELLEQENALSQAEIGELFRTIDVYHSTQLHINRLKSELYGESWNRQKVLNDELDRTFGELRTLADDHPDIDSLKLKTKTISQELSNLMLNTKRNKIGNEYELSRQDFFQKVKEYSERRQKSLLTYIWSERFSKLYVIGRNPQYYFFKTIEVSSDFLETVNKSYQLNAHFQTDFNKLSRQDSLNMELYNILIKPIDKDLTTDNLLVYPIGQLSYISFDALKSNQHKFLIEDYSTSYTSSLFALFREQEVTPAPKYISAFRPTRYVQYLRGCFLRQKLLFCCLRSHKCSN